MVITKQTLIPNQVMCCSTVSTDLGSYDFQDNHSKSIHGSDSV